MSQDRPLRPQAAFTLIELLVVVAIIAILAAIAIPNMLEAQTRAQVARAKADMRVLGGALEAFGVDHGRYPSPVNYDVPPFQCRLAGLTTPIAYITALPDDPFPEENRHNPAVPRRHHYDYFPREAELEQGRSPSEWAAAFGNTEWKVVSAGPDGSYLPPFGDYGFGPLYDPTNGTRSAGDLARTQGGFRPR